MTRTVGILGGGIAGLALAARLAGRGHAVTVYDRDRLGGKLRQLMLAGEVVDTGPSLFTFPQVWRAYLRGLNEPDPLNLRPLPGGLGVHHTPHGPVPLPVPPGHPLHPHWERYEGAAAPLAPFLPVLLTTPPRLRDPLFRQAAAALLRVQGPYLTAQRWLAAQRLPPALTHALATHALNAGLAPQVAPPLYALIPALASAEIYQPERGMGALLDALLAFGQARGVQLREQTTVKSVLGQTLILSRGETARHDLLVSAMDPHRLAALLGKSAPSPLARRTVSGVGVYAVLPHPAPLPATSVLPPSSFAAFHAHVQRGALPPDTLTLVHAHTRQLSILLATPATGEPLTLPHPWVQAQLRRVEETLHTPGLLRDALDVATLAPDHYAQGGHPGGALYGPGLPAWRGGPLHPQPYRLRAGLWQVGTGVHPGGGIPAILGGVQIVDQLLQEAGW
ncbi:phytoene desaturase family protein [Deinococcus radiotolerans]|uniref:Dehydrogenase n=1 Tax=Deinococcus radiotolerans TaxID=1309407 RepID=A0ABQ2FD31_9DEIO|nr:FAD-dependent oxidoreductase [Deinococcus radiotolerans]GGK86574.1 dehydrogenase [Deinococcus radiotolerans]